MKTRPGRQPEEIKKGQAIIFLVLFLVALLAAYLWSAKPSEDTILGHAIVNTHTTIISLQQAINCSLHFEAGWNLVNIGCANSSNTSLANRVNGFSPLVSVHWYDPSDSDDPWKAYNPDLPSYVVLDLTEHNNKDGYWIRVDSESDLNISGTRSIPTFITTFEGPNLIGFALNDTRNISEVLAALDGKFTHITTYNATNGQWLVYYENGTGNLTTAVPGAGYWLNGTEGGFIAVT